MLSVRSVRCLGALLPSRKLHITRRVVILVSVLRVMLYCVFWFQNMPYDAVLYYEMCSEILTSWDLQYSALHAIGSMPDVVADHRNML